jgi:predicted acyl esterase
MRIDWDVPIPMADGTVLRADVFRPADHGQHPVIMTHGPYAKGLAFQEGFPGMWGPLSRKYPDAVGGTSNRYQNWETADPEKWVPDGYVCVRVDSRGAGRSPGRLDILSPQETRDHYECIEWAGVQPWSNGRVGLLGISYYAVNQWQVAALRPPHLAAICPWEGASDYYRDFTHHAGMLNIFTSIWYPAQVADVQHGIGPRSSRGTRNPNTDELIAGPQLSDEELVANRADSAADLLAHPFDDEFYRERSGILEKITVPVLSAANWAHELHTRGNFEGWARVGSDQKWLEVHGLEHFAEFYTDYGVALQKRFFGHFLKGEDTGWDRQPPVHLNVRHVDGGFELRPEQEWPLARTQWTTLHLDPAHGTLTTEARTGSAGFEALGEGLTFTTEPYPVETEITGPMATRLYVSSTTTDADLFLTLRVLDPDGTDVTFVSALDPAGAIGSGWLRASHRATDPERSLPYRPWHPHDHAEPLVPGETVPLDIEIWPTSVVVPAGYRLALTVTGRDFEFPGDGPWPATYGVQMKGHGMFVHTDPADRPADVFGGTTTLVSGPDQRSYLLLPVIPRGDSASVRRGPYPR